MKKYFNKSWQAPIIIALIIIVASVFFYQPPKEALAGWYASGGTWTKRKSITINETYVTGSSDLTNFSILVDITDSDLQANAQSDGDDILFTSVDGTTKLDHEIEVYTSATGRLTAWVRIPTLSYNTNTVIYMYYGNPSSGNQQNADGTWDSSYVAVWHTPNGTTLGLNDSSGNGFTLTNNATTPAAEGKIYGGFQTNGSSQYLSRTHDAAFNPTVITMSTWLKLNGAPTNNGNVMSKNGNTGYRWRVNNARTVTVLDNAGGAFNVVGSGSNTITDATWTKVDIIGSASNIQIYFNGALVGAGGTSWKHTASSGDFQWGTDSTNSEYFKGWLDEGRVSNVVRTVDWITTEYNNQSSTSTFYAISGEIQADSAKVRIRGGGAPAGDKPPVVIRGGSSMAGTDTFTWGPTGIQNNLDDGTDTGSWNQNGFGNANFMDADTHAGWSWTLPAIPANATITKMYVAAKTTAEVGGTVVFKLQTQDVDPATAVRWSGTNLPRNATFINTPADESQAFAAETWYFYETGNHPINLKDDLQDLITKYGAINAGDRINIAGMWQSGGWVGIEDESNGLLNEPELNIEWTVPSGGGTSGSVKFR